tara:strand:+ start:505 stop:684 length:180 start_codon:yes stop_codon:yes gene_type:complete
MNNFIKWQLDNKKDLINIFNLITNNLENNDIMISDKKKFYNNYINYMFHSTKMYKNKYL